MFLKNNVLVFDLNSVPAVFKEGWQIEHGGGHLALESLQASAKFWIRIWWGLTIGSLIMEGVLLFFGKSWFSYPAFQRDGGYLASFLAVFIFWFGT